MRRFAGGSRYRRVGGAAQGTEHAVISDERNVAMAAIWANRFA
jgi:hypothetical protein